MFNTKTQAQDSWLIPSDTFYPARFYSVTGAGFTAYSSAVIGLNQIWYAQYEKSHFHLFNDSGEWLDIDKAGHAYTAYAQTKLATQLFRWSGIDDNKAVWFGVLVGTSLQGTLEIMDGFSKKWGFSLPDLAFNTIGSGLYAAQEFAWKEQRINLKYSYFPVRHSLSPILSNDGVTVTNLSTRAKSLYGVNPFEVALKDYNGTTIWASVNLHSFIKKDDSKFPAWLNIALGYGAGNLYGGFENKWTDELDNIYIADTELYPRYRQFYLSLDVDFNKIPTRSKYLKTLFSFLNFIKIPAPTLELNSLGKVKLHSIFF